MFKKMKVWKKRLFTGLIIAGITISSISVTPEANAAGTGTWSSPYDVYQAITNQNGTTKTVQGYVVGKPISYSAIETSNFSDDYALALADSASQTQVSQMAYVQIPSNFRSTFGLKTNPTLKGKQIKVTGCLSSYFSRAGVKCVTAMEIVGSSGGSTGGGSTDTGTYYNTAEGKTGATLKSALHTIIDDHTELSYDNVWDALRYTDQDPRNSNNVILLYTGRSQSKYDNGGLVDQWNREHVWAKSHGDFGTTMGAGTDLHHLRPTDVSVNSSRGNKDFDYGGTQHSEALGNYTDSDSWEPRDAVKGDVARMLFYMAVRYEGDVFDEVDLELNEYVNNGSAPFHGKLSVLKQWHAQDPVDDFERNRNEIIFSKYQGNRNPFIDRPEWVEAIW
ncbi:endonuclease [Mangrovibacillus cuniculi]|nr:endonuclease [Mangrovibacillus cuniculi]